MADGLPQLPPLFQNPYGPAGVVPDPRHLIHYVTDGVQPPSLLYLDPNDRFRLEILTFDTNITFEFAYRILKPNGEIVVGQERIPITATFPTTQGFFFGNLPFSLEGFLLSAVLHNFNGGTFGQRGLTHARLVVVRGAATSQPQFTQILMQGCVDALGELSWPNGQNEVQCGGQGCLLNRVGTVPAAGADWSESIISSSRWLVQTFRAQLTTSATVASRGVSFIMDDGNLVQYAVEAPVAQPASTVRQYIWAAIGQAQNAVQSNFVTVPIPPGLKTTSGQNLFARFRTITTNIQAGDQWTAPNYLVEHWFD